MLPGISVGVPGMLYFSSLKHTGAVGGRAVSMWFSNQATRNIEQTFSHQNYLNQTESDGLPPSTLLRTPMSFHQHRHDILDGSRQPVVTNTLRCLITVEFSPLYNLPPSLVVRRQVSEMAVSELPGNPNAVWTVRRHVEGNAQLCALKQSQRLLVYRLTLHFRMHSQYEETS